jgi:hypothetical protein
MRCGMLWTFLWQQHFLLGCASQFSILQLAPMLKHIGGLVNDHGVTDGWRQFHHQRTIYSGFTLFSIAMENHQF